MTEDGKFETLHDWGLEIALSDPHSMRLTARIPESLYRQRCPRMLGVSEAPAGSQPP